MLILSFKITSAFAAVAVIIMLLHVAHLGRSLRAQRVGAGWFLDDIREHQNAVRTLDKLIVLLVIVVESTVRIGKGLTTDVTELEVVHYFFVTGFTVSYLLMRLRYQGTHATRQHRQLARYVLTPSSIGMFTTGAVLLYNL